MAVNKVEYGGETLIDLTEDTVTSQTLAEGVTAHGADGEKIVGTLNLDAYLPLSGGTMTGILYTSASTPLLIGVNGKVGMRAKYGDVNNVGQINVSNAWWSTGNQWGSQMSGYNGVTGKYNQLRVSHDGLQFIGEDDVAHQVIHEGNCDDYITKDTVTSALGYTPPTPAELNTKADDYSIQIYNGTGGNPKPVKFATFNYSECNSENGMSAKISMVSGHGNGVSYVFLQDAIINVSYNGTVTVDNFKYFGGVTPVYDGLVRQYGDIFWVIDTTNKIVDFYCLMGQYSRVYMTPWKRLTYSSKGTVTQYTSCTVYSSGTKVWGNNSDIALLSDMPTPIVKLDLTKNNTVKELAEALRTKGITHSKSCLIHCTIGDGSVRFPDTIVRVGDPFAGNSLISIYEWYYPDNPISYSNSAASPSMTISEVYTEMDNLLNTKNKTIAGAISEVNAKSLEMPQIRFVGMPCSGWFGKVDWMYVTGEQREGTYNIKFTIEIVGGGPLQVGDAIQLCGLKLFGSVAAKGNRKAKPKKRKLRRVAEYVITEEDLDKRFITFEVEWNNSAAMRLFHKTAHFTKASPIYFRIRRPKGEINSGSNGGGMTVDAEFSNVISVWKTACYYYDSNEKVFLRLIIS